VLIGKPQNLLYELQDYLKFPIIKVVRCKLTQLRISAHLLEIETGRSVKTFKHRINSLLKSTLLKSWRLERDQHAQG
jgi:hypothetical protein